MVTLFIDVKSCEQKVSVVASSPLETSSESAQQTAKESDTNYNNSECSERSETYTVYKSRFYIIS